METERLTIRNAKPIDVDDIFEMRSSEFVLKYNAMETMTYEQAKAQVDKDTMSENVFYLELKDAGKVIGTIYLEEDSLRYGVNSISLSYYLNENYARKGYMTEAMGRIIKYIFDIRQVDVISARVFSENIASQRLLKKLGFVNEGCIRRCVKGYKDVIYDDLIFSMLREEYQRTQGDGSSVL